MQKAVSLQELPNCFLLCMHLSIHLRESFEGTKASNNSTALQSCFCLGMFPLQTDTARHLIMNPTTSPLLCFTTNMLRDFTMLISKTTICNLGVFLENTLCGEKKNYQCGDTLITALVKLNVRCSIHGCLKHSREISPEYKTSVQIRKYHLFRILNISKLDQFNLIIFPVSCSSLFFLKLQLFSFEGSF